MVEISIEEGLKENLEDYLLSLKEMERLKKKLVELEVEKNLLPLKALMTDEDKDAAIFLSYYFCMWFMRKIQKKESKISLATQKARKMLKKIVFLPERREGTKKLITDLLYKIIKYLQGVRLAASRLD